jgi:hypothetical protein
MNLSTPQTFLVIVDKNIPDLALELSARFPTWVINSVPNKESLKRIPPAERRDLEEKLTLFAADTSVSSEQQFLDILQQIDERSWTTIKVLGVAPTFLISDVLKSVYRVVHIEPVLNGFIATRVLE